MNKYELQKLFFKKSKKLLMTSFFWSRSRSWSQSLPVSVSKPKLRSRSVLVSEKFRGLGLGLGLGRVGLDYSPAFCYFRMNCEWNVLNCMKCEWRELTSQLAFRRSGFLGRFQPKALWSWLQIHAIAACLSGGKPKREIFYREMQQVLFDVDFGYFVLQLQIWFCRERKTNYTIFFITIIFHKNPRLIVAQNLKKCQPPSVTKRLETKKNKFQILKATKFCANSKRWNFSNFPVFTSKILQRF